MTRPVTPLVRCTSIGALLRSVYRQQSLEGDTGELQAPVEWIAPRRLWIGSVQHALDINLLADFGVTHIINVAVEYASVDFWSEGTLEQLFEPFVGDAQQAAVNASLLFGRYTAIDQSPADVAADALRTLCDCRNMLERRIEYIHVPMRDKPSQALPDAALIVQTINEILDGSDRNVILLHCKAGISRSVSVAMLYSLAAQKQSLQDVWQRMLAVHPRARPNTGFYAQLKRLNGQSL